MNEWIEFMLEHGIRRVVCVLAGEKLAKYDDLLGAYRQRFSSVTHAPIDNYGLPTDEVLEIALSAFADAESAGERIVVHCAAGMGRTGLLSSAWLCRRYGIGIDEAITEVCQSAWRVGANRDPLEAGPDSRRVLALALGETSRAT